MECRPWPSRKICSPCFGFDKVQQGCIFIHQDEYIVNTLHDKLPLCDLLFFIHSLSLTFILLLTFERTPVCIGHLLQCLDFSTLFVSPHSLFNNRLSFFNGILSFHFLLPCCFQPFCFQLLTKKNTSGTKGIYLKTSALTAVRSKSAKFQAFITGRFISSRVWCTLGQLIACVWVILLNQAWELKL